MTTYQKQILDFIKQNGGITKKQATELIGHPSLPNTSEYIGLCLTRMVGAKMIRRTMRGVYREIL
jgi:hypothetical protein